MPSLGGWEIVIIVAVLLLLFGAKKLPDMARSIGQSARVFKGEMKGLKDDEGPAAKQDTAQQAPAAPAPLPQSQPQSQDVPAAETTAQAKHDPTDAR